MMKWKGISKLCIKNYMKKKNEKFILKWYLAGNKNSCKLINANRLIHMC